MRRKDDEKERCIKQAVIKVNLDEGLQGASISKIAKLAGVSPATVYIYYENKESMLQDIYTEYSEEVFGYLLRRVDLSMGAPRVVELLVRGYYEYITNHKEEFSFIEQFSNCPSLVRRCSESGSMSTVYNLVAEMKRKHMVRNYNNDTLFAIIFHPVKAIAADDRRSESERDVLLQEIIGMVQDAILI